MVDNVDNSPLVNGRNKVHNIRVLKNLSPEIGRKVREARKQAGLSQSELAAEVGCKQSALSMFEQGDGTKLNDEVIGRLAKKFDIKLTESAEAKLARRPAPFTLANREVPRGFCPNPHCPSHHAYQVEERLLLRPDRAAQDPAGGKFCAVCGEVLEHRCPNCGAPVHDGAVCTFCGEPYVAVAAG